MIPYANLWMLERNVKYPDGNYYELYSMFSNTDIYISYYKKQEYDGEQLRYRVIRDELIKLKNGL